MARQRSREEKLMGAAVLKQSFARRGELQSEMFRSVYPGVLADLELSDEEVDAFTRANADEVAARVSAAVRH